MTLTTTLYDLAIVTGSNLVSNLFYIFLFIWAINFLGKKIGEGIKKVPEWIEQYDSDRMKRIRVQEALDRRER